MSDISGMLLVDKPAGRSSFSVVAELRRITGQKKIGHTGTLDPFATGLLILLLGKKWTSRAHEFLHHTKEYQAVLKLGVQTDTYDCEGKEVAHSSVVPSLEELRQVISRFQGEMLQTPPMFSAKKVGGTRLYELARKGHVIERRPVLVQVVVELMEYVYPYVRIDVRCSKGTYIRSLGNDIGEQLGCFAHLEQLRRTKNGSWSVEDALVLAHNSKEQIESRLVKKYDSETVV